jgi:hypothetical protein
MKLLSSGDELICGDEVLWFLIYCLLGWDYSSSNSYQNSIVCMSMLKGLALPRSNHSGEIALAGSRCLHSPLAGITVEIEIGRITISSLSTAHVC